MKRKRLIYTIGIFVLIFLLSVILHRLGTLMGFFVFGGRLYKIYQY